MAGDCGQGLMRVRPGALGLLMVLAVAGAGCGASSSPAAPSANLGTAMDQVVPSAVLNAPLTDQNGRSTSLARYSGKIVVLADGMTLCQEVCPLTSANLVQLGRGLQASGHGDQVVFVLLTVDPTRDSPGRLAAYRKLFAPTPSDWVTLTGTAADTDAIWSYFGVSVLRVPETDSPVPTDWLTGKPLTYDVEHSDTVIFLDVRQHERFLIDGAGNVQGQALPAELNGFLSQQGRDNRDHPDPNDTWTAGQVQGVVDWLAGSRLEAR
jgi:protein SCO1